MIKARPRFFDPFLITIDHESEVFSLIRNIPVPNSFIWLSGQIEYRHGDKTYILSPGDSLDVQRRNTARPGESFWSVRLRFSR